MRTINNQVSEFLFAGHLRIKCHRFYGLFQIFEKQLKERDDTFAQEKKEATKRFAQEKKDLERGLTLDHEKQLQAFQAKKQELEEKFEFEKAELCHAFQMVRNPTSKIIQTKIWYPIALENFCNRKLRKATSCQARDHGKSCPPLTSCNFDVPNPVLDYGTIFWYITQLLGLAYNLRSKIVL